MKVMNDETFYYLEKKIKTPLRIKSEEDRKTYDEVFDKRTLLAFYHLFSHKILDHLEFAIATGKEANVFRAKSGSKSYAVKVFRTSNFNFNAIINYIEGDYRFEKVKKTRDNIIFLWTQKEFKNLDTMHRHGIKVPKPIYFYQNLLVMQYLGTDSAPAPILKNANLKDPKKTFEKVRDMIVMLVDKAGLVHADLSEYNVLYYRNTPYFMDVGQALPISHSLAKELLYRDVRNIVKFFNKYELDVKEESILKLIQRKL